VARTLPARPVAVPGRAGGVADRAEGRAVCTVAWTQRGDYLAVGPNNGAARIYDAAAHRTAHPAAAACFVEAPGMRCACGACPAPAPAPGQRTRAGPCAGPPPAPPPVRTPRECTAAMALGAGARKRPGRLPWRRRSALVECAHAVQPPSTECCAAAALSGARRTRPGAARSAVRAAGGRPRVALRHQALQRGALSGRRRAGRRRR